MLNIQYLNPDEYLLKSYLSYDTINKFNKEFLDEIDDIYYMSNYISFLFINSGGGLMELDLVEKIIDQNKYKNLKLFIVDHKFYNFKRKIIFLNAIKKKINVECYVFPCFKDFYNFIHDKIIRLDFVIGVNNFYLHLKDENRNYWKGFIDRLVGSYGINDKQMYIVNQTIDKYIVEKLSLYKLSLMA